MGDQRLLALDLGSSSVRAVTFRAADLHRGSFAQRPVTIAASGEVDTRAYIAAVVECLDELNDRNQLDDVSDVAIAAMWHSIVAVDRRDDPIGPASAWVGRSPSPRAVDEEQARALHARTGCRPHGLYYTERIPALRNQSGSTLARFVSLPALVVRALGGPAAESRSMASGTGLIDLATGGWDNEALDLAGIVPGNLLPLQGSRETWTNPSALAPRWPALTGAVWHAVVGDGAASNVGSGAATPARLAGTIGTSSAVRVVHRRDEAPAAPFECWRYLVDDERVVTGIASSAGGNVFAWASDLARVPRDRPLLEAALGSLGTDPTALVAVPQLFGARPGDPPGLSGSIVGLHATTTPVELLRAFLDGVGFELRRIADVVAALATPPTPLAIGGGAISASPWWRRRLADQLGRVVRVVTEREVAALGAVALATGRTTDPTEALPPPAHDTAEAFTRAADRYAAVRAAMASIGSNGEPLT